MLKKENNNHSADPLVSVIVCSYNRADLISTTLNSILHQNCDFPFELIIGDDRSTDDVRLILIDFQRRYPDKIKLLLHDENFGPGANWASCFKLCKGKYIAGCDNDDFWNNPEKLKIQVDFMEQNPDVGMVHTDYRLIAKNHGIEKDIVIHDKTYPEPFISSVFYGKFLCCHSSALYRKDVIDRYIKIDDYIALQFPLYDWSTWTLLAKFTRFHCLPLFTTTTSQTNGSVTRPIEYNTVIDRFKKEKIMYAYLCERFPNDLKFRDKVYDFYVYSILLNMAYEKKDYHTAKLYASRMKEIDKINFKTKMALNGYTFILLAYLKIMFPNINKVSKQNRRT